MHIIISALIAIATLVYWLGRASKGAREIADTAQEISNLPRKMRYRKKAGKQGLALVENPLEAAAVLMISIARMDDVGRVSEAQAKAIATQLTAHMQLPSDEAADMVVQMRSLSQYLTQAESALFPMVDLLRVKISKAESMELSAMLQDIAVTETPINQDQINFIRRFEERMGIGH